MRGRSEAPAQANGVNAVTNGISDIRRVLAQKPDTPQVRALRGRLQSYEHIVAEWITAPPTEPQRSAMVECLRDLRARVEAIEEGPDVPLRGRTTRPPAPSSRVPSGAPAERSSSPPARLSAAPSSRKS